MSDISILSRRYEAISELSTSLNEAILILKKNALKTAEPRRAVSQVMDWSEVDEARDVLYKFSDDLIKTLDRALPSETAIPYSLLEAFQKLSRTDPYFIPGLTDLHHRLGKHQDLTEENFELLDKLLSVVDADVSAVFRKLWRKR